MTFRVALRLDNYHVFTSCDFVLGLDSDSSMELDSRLVEIAFLLQPLSPFLDGIEIFLKESRQPYHLQWRPKELGTVCKNPSK